jgi:PEP-CTERM/exosortase A-associated glycosyltransferase
MRILHILDHSLPLHSGYSFRTLSILNEQRALGWETYHLTSAKQGACSAAEEQVEGWHFFRMPDDIGPLYRLPVINQCGIVRGLTARLRDVALQVRPNILHAHSPVLNAIPALQVGRRLGLPVVYEVRAFWEDAAVDHGTIRRGGIRYRLTRGLETYAMRRAQAITTICEGLRQDILARGIPEEKVTVIPNAVDVTKFSLDGVPDDVLRARLGLPLDGAKVLGFIGSFYAYEGLALLLQAMPEILGLIPNARVLLVGGGPQERELKRLAWHMGIEDKVIFAGRVPHHQVQRYYDLIDILVYPRLSMRLTELVTPLKPLEAMAKGRPLLASDVGGHREIIRDGETGLLFKAGDVHDLAAKVLEWLGRESEWAGMRTAGRRWVEGERNWAASVARYRSIYARLMPSP